MSQKQYILCDTEGRELPSDATDYAIVYDPATNIEWAADVLPEKKGHDSSIKAVSEFSLAGGGWRLPTYHEGASIVDPARFNPARDQVFRGPDFGVMWTSTPDASDPDFAWVVDLYGGYVYLYYRGLTAWVRPCRVRACASQ